MTRMMIAADDQATREPIQVALRPLDCAIERIAYEGAG